MTRVHNFSAGPAALPLPVLERAQAEMLDYRGTGMSVMEMSHRSKAFVEIAERAEANLIELLNVPPMRFYRWDKDLWEDETAQLALSENAG